MNNKEEQISYFIVINHFKNLNMKHCFFLIFIILFSACEKNDEKQKYSVINIKENYPYVYEKHIIGDIPPTISELFSPTIYLINSIEALQENPLFNYCPNVLKEQLVNCNFEYNTLILTSCANLQEVTKLEYQLYFDNYFSEYEYIQTFYSNSLEEEVECVYLIITSFTIQKIPEDTEVSFSRILRLN